MTLNSFADVQNMFNTFISTNNIPISGAPHAAFWQQSPDIKTSYTDFVSGNVPGVKDGFGQPIPILVSGSSSMSWIVQILKGPVTINGKNFRQMPDFPTKMSADQLKALADWIDAKCPFGSTLTNVTPAGPAIALKSFADVQNMFNTFISTNHIPIGGAPHAAFWQQSTDIKKSYSDFVSGNVPGVKDGFGQPIPILVSGSSSTSWIVQILKGPVTINGKNFRQMPDAPTKMSADQINALAAWIDAKCPFGSSAVATAP
jgi:hypothetical protein